MDAAAIDTCADPHDVHAPSSDGPSAVSSLVTMGGKHFHRVTASGPLSFSALREL